MRKLLNTLFVTKQGAYLSKEGECVVISLKTEQLLKIPIHTLDGIICFGNVLCSPFLLGYCAGKNITISFLTEYGRFLARVQGPVCGNVLLRQAQYRYADDEKKSGLIARNVVLGKLANSRIVLRRVLRDHQDKVNKEVILQALSCIENAMKHAAGETDMERIRGYEGEAAKSYFGVFDNLILAQKDEFVFNGRNRRPPLDKVNCLLSFIYTIVLHDVRSALESVGLDPAVGYLHRARPGRPSLALDLMEEFRSFFADRLALSLINLKKVKGSGFETSGSGAVIMNDETRKTLLVGYQERKQEEILHPFIKEKAKIGQVFFIQAMLFARFIRGDIEAYPPFIWR